MTFHVRLDSALTPERFAPYGTLIHAPDKAGERLFYSNWLGGVGAAAPVLHVNHVEQSVLPLAVNALECHPHASQVFLPLDVSRYLVTVAPPGVDGRPLMDKLESFIVPGNIGIAYRRGVWHAGATVLDRKGHFAVLMWRGLDHDDVFENVPSFTIVDADAALTAAAQEKSQAEIQS